MVTRRVLLLFVAWLACAAAPARAADDDFTDIPDIDGPAKPASPAPPKPGVKPAPPPVSSGAAARPPGAVVAAPVAKDPIQRYLQLRHAAINDKVYILSACGDVMWGGDSRRAHAFIARGDDWLSRGDAIWHAAQRTGDRSRMPRAFRDLAAAHGEYRAARRFPPPLHYHGTDSPKPAPFPSAYPSEPHPTPGMGAVRVEAGEQWRRHDELPLEEPSKFEEDPHY